MNHDQTVTLSVPAPDWESGSIPAEWDWTTLADSFDPIRVVQADEVRDGVQSVTLDVPTTTEYGEPALWDWTTLADSFQPVVVLSAGPLTQEA